MRTTKTILFITGLWLLFFSSCEEFIETDLSKKHMSIIAPSDNIVSPNFSQTFWWEELKGADAYQIQIVKPNFNSIQQFITDTTVHSDKLTLSLAPGTYQWRIRAKNGSSSTDFVTRNLTIDSTLNLAGQTLGLLLPINNAYTKNLTNTFTWQSMPNSQYYVMQVLLDGSFINTQSYTGTSASFTFPSEGVYEWRVFAQNSTSNSAYNTRTITIDTTSPALPLVVFPLTDTTSNDSIQLSWSGSESNLSYRIQISTDSTFTFINKDTTTSITNYEFINLTLGQNYYWRVKAIDQALNESTFIYRRRIKRI